MYSTCQPSDAGSRRTCSRETLGSSSTTLCCGLRPRGPAEPNSGHTQRPPAKVWASRCLGSVASSGKIRSTPELAALDAAPAGKTVRFCHAPWIMAAPVGPTVHFPPALAGPPGLYPQKAAPAPPTPPPRPDAPPLPLALQQT